MRLFVFTLFLAFTLGNLSASAQGSGERKPDYTYTNPQLSGRTVSFYDKDSNLYLTTKGKTTAYPLPKKNDSESLLKLFYESKKKLTPEDLFLVQIALPKWDSVRMTLGYTMTASGLGYKMTTKGTGKLPESGKKVKVHYRGTLADGKVFDSSFERGTPIDFTLGTGQVIRGWDEGIQLFPVGSKGVLMIPPALGYGARGAGGVIPPNATLFFEIEVVDAD
jgi:hypothetical protein